MSCFESDCGRRPSHAVATAAALCVLGLFGLSGCGRTPADTKQAGGGMAKKFQVLTESAKVQDVTYAIESVGTLEAEEDVRIPARVDGVASTVSFEEGDSVTAEMVLAEIDAERYRLELARQDAELEKAKAEVKDAEQAYEQRLNLRSQDSGWVSQEELRKLLTALDRAKAEVSRAQVELDLAKKKLEDSRVKSPFPGIINSKGIATGEYVRPDTTVATIARVETLKLKFTIPEVDAARIEVNQTVRFAVRAIPEKAFSGRIYFISTTADPATRMVDVKARVSNTDLKLRPGYFASVSLETSIHREAVVIPEEAVIPTEDGFVSFVVEGGKARQRMIDIGQRMGGRVEILKGVEPGDAVVIRGGQSLSDGMDVDARPGV